MNFSRTNKVIMMLCLSFSLSAAAAPKGLIEIYNLAKNNDAQFSAEIFDAQALYQRGGLSRSGLLPSVDLSGAYSYNYSDVDYAGSTTSDFSQEYQGQSVSLQVRQPLVRFDGIQQHRRNRINQHLASIDEALAQQGLLQRVASNYFSVLKEIENLAADKARESAFAENLEKAKLSFDLGSNTITDKLEAQARYDLARSDTLDSLNQLIQRQEELKILVGGVSDLLPLNSEIDLPRVQPEDVNYWRDTALSNNLHLQRAKKAYEYAQREVSVARAEYLPKIDLVGSMSHSAGVSFSGSDQTRNDAAVSVQLDMPLFSGGSTRSAVKEQQALKDQKQQQLDQTERQTSLAAQVTYNRVTNGYTRLQSLAQAVKSSQSAVEATTKGVEVGIRTNLDLLNAQQQLFETKRNFINQRYDYLFSLLELKAVAGQLVESDLLELDKLFR